MTPSVACPPGKGRVSAIHYRNRPMRPLSLIVRRHLVVNIPYQRYPHLSGIVASENIADEVRFYLHVHLHAYQVSHSHNL